MAPNTTNSQVSFEPFENENEKCSARQVKEILVDGFLYDVTDWSRRHPGGRIIEFYTENGEDASTAVQQFHYRSKAKVQAIMSSLKRRPAILEIGKGDGLDPDRRKRHAALTRDFNELFIQFEKEGLFEPSFWHIVLRLGELLVLLTLTVILCQKDSLPLIFLGSILYGIYTGRSSWVYHETGHHSFTGHPRVDRWFQMVVMAIAAGLSSSYWRIQHNRHHAMPQRIQRDVDLDTLPLLAFNSKVVKNPSKWKPNIFVRHQAILFAILDTFIVGLTWKFILHPRYVFRKRKYQEMFWMAFHYILPYHIGFWPTVIGTYIATVYMFINFALSHTHLPVTEEPRHWVEYGLIHTTDIEPSWFCDWWMGYLNCQIEHHLFPTMPQYRNRLIKDRVKALAQKHNIPYQSASYWSAVAKTFKNLHQVSQELIHH